MLLTNLRQLHCSLDNYTGPLECLYQLVQRKEIDIRDVSLHHLADQCLQTLLEERDSFLEVGAEFVATLAGLLWLKSRTLLPRPPLLEEEEPLDEALNFDIIHQLLDYCRIKELAKQLKEQEAAQGSLYKKGVTPHQPAPQPPQRGIEHLSIEDLAQVFQQVSLAAQATPRQTIADEEWKVSDKIATIRHAVRQGEQLDVYDLFRPTRSKPELIVTFLALLELMKCGDIALCRNPENQSLWIESINETGKVTWAKPTKQ